MDLNKNVESPCRRSSEWGFVGVLKSGKVVPIGTYSSYRDGAAHANSWMRATPDAARWEGEVLYYPMEDENE